MKIEENTIERFNNASNSYKSHSIYYRGKSMDLVSKLLLPNKEDVILDIGCGPGTQLIKLSSSIKMGIGIDISNRMLSRAKKEVKSLNINNIIYHNGDFIEFDYTLFEKFSINKVISNYALHHLSLEDKKSAIKKICFHGKKLLKQLIIGDVIFFDKPNKYRHDFEDVGYSMGHAFPCKADELVAIFENLQFKVKVIQLHPLVGVIAATKDLTK